MGVREEENKESVAEAILCLLCSESPPPPLYSKSMLLASFSGLSYLEFSFSFFFLLLYFLSNIYFIYLINFMYSLCLTIFINFFSYF